MLFHLHVHRAHSHQSKCESPFLTTIWKCTFKKYQKQLCNINQHSLFKAKNYSLKELYTMKIVAHQPTLFLKHNWNSKKKENIPYLPNVNISWNRKQMCFSNRPYFLYFFSNVNIHKMYFVSIDLEKHPPVCKTDCAICVTLFIPESPVLQLAAKRMKWLHCPGVGLGRYGSQSHPPVCILKHNCINHGCFLHANY